MLWEVWFYHFGQKYSTYVRAESFDEAIKVARSLDMRYDSAQVCGEKKGGGNYVH